LYQKLREVEPQIPDPIQQQKQSNLYWSTWFCFRKRTPNIGKKDTLLATKAQLTSLKNDCTRWFEQTPIVENQTSLISRPLEKQKRSAIGSSQCI
jgi:hypothetical protein